MLGLSDDLDKLVLPQKLLDWPKIKEKWFSKHSGCKIPGLLKIGL